MSRKSRAPTWGVSKNGTLLSVNSLGFFFFLGGGRRCLETQHKERGHMHIHEFMKWKEGMGPLHYPKNILGEVGDCPRLVILIVVIKQITVSEW